MKLDDTVPQKVPCSVCGKPTKSVYRVCARTDECKKAQRDAWGHANRERRASYVKKYREENIESVKAGARAWYEKDKVKHPLRMTLANAKSRAKRRGIEFNLCEDDIQIPEFCPVLGIKLAPGSGKQTDYSPSLDRIDNNKGYIVGNVAVISLRANRIKGYADPSELEAVLSYMREKGL